MDIKFVVPKYEEVEHGVYVWRNYGFSSLCEALNFILKKGPYSLLCRNEDGEFSVIIKDVKPFLTNPSES